MAEPLALAYVLPSLVTGGAELQSLQQIGTLRRRGHRVGLILLSARSEPALLDHSDLAGVPVLRLEGPSNVLDRACLRALPRAIGPGARFLGRHRLRHVVAAMPAAHLFGRLVTLRLARAGQRLTLYRHSTEYLHDWARTPGMRAYHLACDTLGRLVDTGHIHVSQAVYAHNAAHGFTRNNLVLPNAVDFARPPDLAAAAAILDGLPPAAWTLVIGGRLHAIKGHRFFLAVLAQLVARQRLGPQALRLVIAGDGPEEAAIRADIARLGLGPHVHLVGRQPNACVLGLFALADLVVVPSLSEPFGVVAIEAQSVGARLVTSNAHGLDEIVRDGTDGWKFPAGDAGAALSLLGRRWADRAAPWDAARVRATCHARFALDPHIDRLVAYLARPGL